MISLLLKFGSFCLSVLRYGKDTLADCISFLRRAWQSAAENTRKLIGILLLLVVILLGLCLKECGGGRQNNNKPVGQLSNTGNMVKETSREARGTNSFISKVARATITATENRLISVATARAEKLSILNGLQGGNREAIKDYSWSHNIGVEAFYPKGFGGDIRFFRYRDFGGQAGLSYFTKEERLSYSVGGCYNIHKLTKEYTQNTWIFVSYTPQSVIGGVRIDL